MAAAELGVLFLLLRAAPEWIAGGFGSGGRGLGMLSCAGRRRCGKTGIRATPHWKPMEYNISSQPPGFHVAQMPLRQL